MKLIAHAGASLENTRQLLEILDALTASSPLLLAYQTNADVMWITLYPEDGIVTRDWIQDVLHPALMMVTQGCFDLYRAPALLHCFNECD